jgi:voltage-gated potassium channel
MRLATLKALVGLGGVAPDETEVARRWARHFEWPMLLVAFWIPIQWYGEVRGLLHDGIAQVAHWLIWGVFVVETTVLTRLVHRKRAYLAANWLSLVIIVGAFPPFWEATPLAGLLRALRLVLAVGVMARVTHGVHRLLARNRLGVTLAVSGVVVLMFGVAIAFLDPAIENPMQGIWWAWVTVTTVGYGDVVPSSVEGRVLAGILILLGVALFSLLTANISAFLLGEDQEREERELRGRLQDIQNRLERIEAHLEELSTGRTEGRRGRLK